MRFSQRKGLTPASKAFQLESIDDELRNGLWDAVIFALDGFNTQFINSNTRTIFFPYWHLYFKAPTDTIPNQFDRVVTIFRKYFFDAEWFQVYDFLEFTAEHYPYKKPEPFKAFTNTVLERENSAYRFVGKEIAQITSQIEIDSINEALELTKKISGINAHIESALEYLSDRKNPDYRNSIKESISAVEAVCIEVTGENGATLGKLLGVLHRKKIIHKSMRHAFEQLYNYTSDADGIRHAMLEETDLSYEDAKYFLVVCSAFVNFVLPNR